MARYCFYCGRELEPGEKCDCRHHQESRGAQSDQTDTGHSSGSSARKNSTDIKSKKKKRPAQKKSRKTPFQTKRTVDSQHHTAALRSLFRDALKHAGRLLAHPAEQIQRYALGTGHRAVPLFLILLGTMSGLLTVQATEQTYLKTIFGLSIVSAQFGGQLSSRLFLFIEGAGIGLSLFLLHTLIYHLLLRYVFRQAFSFHRLINALSPSGFFSALFLLAGSMMLAGSFINTLLMVVAAIVIAILVQSTALRQATALTDNQVIILTATAMFMLLSLIALILNLSLPVLEALRKDSFLI